MDDIFDNVISTLGKVKLMQYASFYTILIDENGEKIFRINNNLDCVEKLINIISDDLDKIYHVINQHYYHQKFILHNMNNKFVLLNNAVAKQKGILENIKTILETPNQNTVEKLLTYYYNYLLCEQY